MDKVQKVVWSEGMFLTPHHFQHWDRYHDMLLSERLRSLTPFGWGLTELDIDTDGLVNGNFALLSLHGVMPDGLVVKIPDQDPSPEARSLGNLFSPTLEHLDVFIGIPVEYPGAANCRLDNAAGPRSTRYVADYTKVPDDNTGENVREITVAQKNLKIFFSGEDTADYITVKIAELVRTAGGTNALRETYIPPCLSVSASAYLMRLVRGLLDVLSAKSNSLTGVQRGAAESGTADMVKFSLLHTVNSYTPLLSHICQVGTVHPEVLFLTLSQLAGELTTFSPDYHSKDLSPYHHTDLSKTFKDLEQKIRAMVESVTPTQCISIPLVTSRENIWSGRVSDERLFVSSRFYLAAAGDLPEEQTREQIPRRVKVGSTHELDLIVSTAMPGVHLYHTPRPPMSIPVKAGHQYFRLENQGEFWNSICRSQSLAFYVPADLKGLRFELLAVKE
ncbi:MAG: type VI secretion system baseplate subunit TssK [Nitrospirae bacterium]|nr:type VI secretion system baseplate subunit TssK [Nitrospirota bacterium]